MMCICLIRGTFNYNFIHVLLHFKHFSFGIPSSSPVFLKAPTAVDETDNHVCTYVTIQR